MTTAAVKALQLAQNLIEFVAEADFDRQGFDLDGEHYSAADLRHHMFRALESLRQQPLVIDGIAVHARLRNAARAAGSEPALARQIGCTRQALADVMNSRREPGPAILTYLKLRKVSPGRTLYTPDDEGPKPKPARSERRQRAWDGPSGSATDAATAP